MMFNLTSYPNMTELYQTGDSIVRVVMGHLNNANDVRAYRIFAEKTLTLPYVGPSSRLTLNDK